MKTYLKSTIKIINVDPIVIKKIDFLAKSKKQSRSEYLRNLLENFVYLQDFNEFESKYKDLVEKCLTIINLNTKQLEKLNGIGDDFL